MGVYSSSCHFYQEWGWGLLMVSKRRHRFTLRRTAAHRAEWAKERQDLVGKLITQEGWVGALVKEHIRGSQYLIRLADGQEVYASHKKYRHLSGSHDAFTVRGWRLWED